MKINLLICSITYITPSFLALGSKLRPVLIFPVIKQPIIMKLKWVN